VVGVLGIGPNDVFPGTSTVITALPGTLNQGVLVNQPQNQLVFGPNPLTPIGSVTGSPTVSNLDVQVTLPGHSMTSTTVPSLIIDSGDNFGSIPASLLNNAQTSGSVPAGTVISVYDGSQLLYTYTTTSTDGLTVTGSVMNTGIEAFLQGPVYISESPSGLGTTTFDT
jgi:PE-PGRS C-terminal aspartyl peptidase-like domain